IAFAFIRLPLTMWNVKASIQYFGQLIYFNLIHRQELAESGLPVPEYTQRCSSCQTLIHPYPVIFPFEKRFAMLQNCGHVFCQYCVWLRLERSCPVCRRISNQHVIHWKLVQDEAEKEALFER